MKDLKSNSKFCFLIFQSDVFVTISSSSDKNVKFSVQLTLQETFRVQALDRKFNAKLSPSAPIFFQVQLPEDVDSALIKMASNDRICAIMSVQNISCPVYDLDLNVQFEGSYQTVVGQGGLAFTKKDYPSGVFLVLVAKSDDSRCTKSLRLNSEGSPNDNSDRVKTVSLEVQRLISDDEYFIATFGAFGIFVGFYLIVLLISCVLCIKEHRMGSIEEDQSPIVATIEVNPDENIDTRLETIPEEDDLQTRQRNNINGDTNEDAIEVAASNHSEDSSIDETDIDFLDDAEREKDVFRTKTFLYVSDLARKSPRVLAKKSALYHWNLMTIAIFYGLPVVQLVLTYQNVTNSTGNQDMCYYNFLCAHPLGHVKDFNHIFSNLGYVLLGILFMLIVSR